MDSLRENDEIDPRLRSFLSEVARPMGKLPQDRRESLLLELRTHIEKLVEDYEAEGRSTDRAIVDAIAMMGDPKQVGRDYVRAWYRSTEPGGVLAAFGLMMIASMVCDSIFHPLLVQVSMNVRAISSALLYVYMVMGTCVPPMVTGWVAGWLAPKGAVQAAAIRLGLSAATLIEALVLFRHGNIGTINGFGLGLVGSVVSLILAAAARRLRMHKLAGI